MAEHHPEAHSSWIKTPKQLIIVVLLAFAVPITLIVMVIELVTGGGDFSKNNPGMSDEAIARRLKPVGQVAVVTAPAARRVEKGGREVVEAVCASCHATGTLNAPRIGDKKAWAKLIEEGLSRLTEIAIKGIRQMPPHGGNPDLSDFELKRAIVYMVNQSGGNWIEPVSPTAAPAARTGEQIVQAQCIKCHEAGIGGAPKIGDRKAWTARVKRGLEPVIRSAIKGHGGMPARGGMADLSDAELRNAVIFMFSAAAAAEKTPKPATPAAAPAAAPAPAATAAPAKGKAVYEASCAVCHGSGVAGAPKVGDKAAWTPRLKGGMDALYASSIKGKNAMPPKGGNLSLAEADVKAAVDYMVGLVR